MNLARKNVILAAVAGFIAWGLAVRALPVLRFLGYAFTLGCIATFLAFLAATLTVSRSRAPYEAFSSPSSTLPAVLLPSKWPSEVSHVQRSQKYQPLQLYDKSFVVSQALDSLLGL